MKAKQLLLIAEDQLKTAGTENTRFEARQLLSHITHTEPLLLTVENREIAPNEEAAFFALLERRVKREPLQYILGIQYFMGLPFEVGPEVLIPRFDTESMCEDAVRLLPKGARVLDLCTGSGALAVAVKHLRPDTAVFASDLSEKALSKARKNAEKNGVSVTFLQGDLFAPLLGMRFGAILTNPPYIPDGDIPGLSEEVRKEPLMALVGGPDGLDFYRRILSEAPNYLCENGLIWLEAGDGEADRIREMMLPAFDKTVLGQDLSGHDRWLRGQKRAMGSAERKAGNSTKEP